MTDFIETYDHALDSDYCDHLIAQFEAGEKHAGATSGGVNTASKVSEDIVLDAYPEWHADLQKIINITLHHLISYMKKYRHLLVGALHTQMRDPISGQLTDVSEATLETLNDDAFAALIGNGYRPGTVNLQKYPRGQGHYNSWHSEIVPTAGDPEYIALHRVLTFMYYLNDVEEGGETEIYYYKRKLKPRKGQLVIKPAGFTHTHRGNTPLSNDKYILTSWILFRTAADMFGEP